MLDELAGKRVDRFEVLGLLGKGAMGAVHRARVHANDDVDRLQAILLIIDEHADPIPLLETLRDPSRETLHRQLLRLGRTDEAERVRAATALLPSRPDR